MANPSLPNNNFQYKESDVRRFWSYVDKTAAGGCWTWNGYTIKDGYGRFRISRHNVLAHRFSFLLANGFLTLQPILHSCDNPPCVNPQHLRNGTHAENMREARERGRIKNVLRGSQVKLAKLTETDIPLIRQMLTDGLTNQAIADQFGVSQVAISRISLGKTWRHA